MGGGFVNGIVKTFRKRRADIQGRFLVKRGKLFISDIGMKAKTNIRCIRYDIRDLIHVWADKVNIKVKSGIRGEFYYREQCRYQKRVVLMREVRSDIKKSDSAIRIVITRLAYKRKTTIYIRTIIRDEQGLYIKKIRR